MKPVTRKAVLVRVCPDLHQWLKELGAKQDRSLNYVVNQLLASAKTASDQKGFAA